MLGIKGMGRKIEEQQVDRCMLREETEPYNAVFGPQNELLRPENNYFWNDSPANSEC
jgi:hypothetical protein